MKRFKQCLLLLVAGPIEGYGVLYLDFSGVDAAGVLLFKKNGVLTFFLFFVFLVCLVINKNESSISGFSGSSRGGHDGRCSGGFC